MPASRSVEDPLQRPLPRDAAVRIATAGGIGFLPIAPATWGSFVVALILWLIGAPVSAWRVGLVAMLAGGLAPVAVWAADHAEQRYGHDARCIVIDEAVGMLFAALLIPWDLLHLLAAFVLFRVFDVLKPPPVFQLQSLPGGRGVLMDDVAAGAYSLLVLLAAQLWVPGF